MIKNMANKIIANMIAQNIRSDSGSGSSLKCIISKSPLLLIESIGFVVGERI